jgi:hypothetical protein
LKSGERVLLFAHPRSGSSNLYQIMRLHPALEILEEPFNENYVNWHPENKDYLGLVRDIESLDEQLAEIFTRFNGVKVLNYQLSDELVEHLLLRPDFRVVFVRRRNVLQAVVSNLIAEQTNLWKKWDMTRSLESYYDGLQPLDLDDVRARVEWLSWHMQLCESILDKRADGRVLKIVYEDFYFAPRKEQAEYVEAVWRFLDLEPIPTADLEYYLRPELTKLNSPATYRFLPNAQEVNDLCGSDSDGWLFESDGLGVDV